MTTTLINTLSLLFMAVTLARLRPVIAECLCNEDGSDHGRCYQPNECYNVGSCTFLTDDCPSTHLDVASGRINCGWPLLHDRDYCCRKATCTPRPCTSHNSCGSNQYCDASRDCWSCDSSTSGDGCHSDAYNGNCPPKCVDARWYMYPWGECSRTCGGGTRTRSVQCQRFSGSDTQVSVGYCDASSKPAMIESCNTYSCASQAPSPPPPRPPPPRPPPSTTSSLVGGGGLAICSDVGINDRSDCQSYCSRNLRFNEINNYFTCTCLLSGWACSSISSASSPPSSTRSASNVEDNGDGGGGGSNTGMIIGLAAGGAAFVLASVIGVVCCLRKRRKEEEAYPGGGNMQGNMENEVPGHAMDMVKKEDVEKGPSGIHKAQKKPDEDLTEVNTGMIDLVDDTPPEPNVDSLEVTVPAGTAPGTLLQVIVPDGYPMAGQNMQFQVPSGLPAEGGKVAVPLPR